MQKTAWQVAARGELKGTWRMDDGGDLGCVMDVRLGEIDLRFVACEGRSNVTDVWCVWGVEAGEKRPRGQMAHRRDGFGGFQSWFAVAIAQYLPQKTLLSLY
jgi:hypothetical protein